MNWKNPVEVLAFGFGSGLAPKAPGTLGTITAIPLVMLLGMSSLTVYLLVTGIMVITGIWICDQCSKELGVEDHPGIVWDEMSGFLVSMIAVPVSWQTLLAAFLLFRFFDILKPFPIRQIDKRLKGGLGIMLDDILAGLASLVILQALIKLQYIPV